jgi:hypothetical protein
MLCQAGLRVCALRARKRERVTRVAFFPLCLFVLLVSQIQDSIKGGVESKGSGTSCWSDLVWPCWVHMHSLSLCVLAYPNTHTPCPVIRISHAHLAGALRAGCSCLREHPPHRGGSQEDGGLTQLPPLQGPGYVLGVVLSVRVCACPCLC